MKIPLGQQMPAYRRDSSLDQPIYRLGDAAAAAGVTPALLKSWVSREPIILPLGHYDRSAQGTGKARHFTLRRVIAAAITQELTELGINAARAGIIATIVTDKEIPDRGITVGSASHFIVVVYADGEVSVFPHGIKSPSLEDAFVSHEVSSTGGTTCFVAVSFWAVFRKVTTRLAKSGWKELPIG